MTSGQNQGGTYIPPEKRDSAWPLWHKLFTCRVKLISTMSEDYIKLFGMPSTGIPEYDREIPNEMVIRMLTINQMVEFFKQGVTVHVIDYKDTKTIYELITDHLMAWKQKLAVGFNNRAAPIEDLILLDQFANVVYKHAAPQFTTEIYESILARQISSTLRVSRQNVLAKPKTYLINADTGEKEVVEEKIPERVSMADDFNLNKGMIGVPNRWK